MDDVDLHLARIFVRANEHRRLKTKRATRTVSIWPELRDILLAHINERAQELDGLLFASNRHDDDVMLDNVDRSLDKLGQRAGIQRPRLHAFRHSYISARVQTLDGGQPVSLFTVAREVGHASTRLIEERYGHLVHVAERSDVVEFRLDHYPDEVGGQVALMAS